MYRLLRAQKNIFDLLSEQINPDREENPPLIPKQQKEKQPLQPLQN